MTYGMENTESRDVIQFPKKGVEATNVPYEKMVFRASDGMFKAKSNNTDYSGDLSRELSQSFEQIRSMMIFSEVPFRLKGVYENPVHFSAGWTPLQELPETDKFEVDYGHLNRQITPSEVFTGIKAFNTPRLQVPDDSKKVTVSKDQEKEVGTSYETMIAVPTSVYDNGRFKVHNIDSADDEDPQDAVIRVNSYAAGDKYEEGIDTDSTSTTKDLAVGSYGSVNISTPSEFVEIEAKSKTGNTKLRVDFVGESN